MVRTTALIIALSIASPALAQTTTCGWEMGKWVCRTPQPRAAPNQIFNDGQRAFQQGYENGQAMMDSFRRNQAAAQEARAEQSRAQQQEADARLAVDRRRLESIEIVKGYIAANMCDDARRVANENFGADGIRQVNELCK